VYRDLEGRYTEKQSVFPVVAAAAANDDDDDDDGGEDCGRVCVCVSACACVCVCVRLLPYFMSIFSFNRITIKKVCLLNFIRMSVLELLLFCDVN